MKSGLNTQDAAIIRVSGNSFDFVSFVSARLQLAGIYKFSTQSDFLYFLLLAFRSSGLLTETSHLYLCGEIDKESKLIDSVHKYIRNYSFVVFSEITIADENIESPKHFFAAL
jgi:hypothetical protein